ncbi:TIGR03084 family metal-binding protein [Tsukamurella paurometabola]|uniref:Mycothiol maleylpyruvate isomerase N-terminal domain n=2 Tax=Tsukamurella paurometabola TaxID=2061 RepID=A0A3P8KT47_TSUPA|nr:TIGR03084 family metal-binding protein [Tsukamurella paurometabola]UEA82843.1 TIGR03084 family protein [Tsukamurella paurometabola]VDR39917.1 Mycothiol maleylpyruvate isomerase N-terminal domain [Tsukamurella paurometabola]
MPTSAPVFDALESTSAAVAAIADSLPDWSIATPAEGWTVAHQVAHLTWTDEVSLVAATDPDGFAAILKDAMADPMGFVDAGAAELATDPDLRARWDRGRAALAVALREADPGTPLPWFGPPMRPATMANARLMETWAHGLDIADAAGTELDAPEALPHVAKIAYKTRDFAYTVNGETPPAEPFDVFLVAADGAEITFGPGDAAQRVTGSLEDFCRLATQRINVADTDLVATGADAAHWLTIAQCFAGAPGTGRAPQEGRP